MPLRPGIANIGQNIEEMDAAGHPHRQSLAASFRKAYGTQKRANGGHVGPLTGDTPGRADHVPTTVESGSHIIPSDVVSALGEGNSAAGFKLLLKRFPHSDPHRAWGGGVTQATTPKMPSMTGTPHMSAAPHMIGIPHPHMTGVPHLAGIPKPVGIAHMASGGETGHQVPVKLSDGEMSVAPKDVIALGGGDAEHGHRILDEFILATRKAHIKKLKSLPAPVGSHKKK